MAAALSGAPPRGPSVRLPLMTDEIQAPKIEFPSERYPIKVIGDAHDGFVDLVIEVIQRHAPDLDASTLVQRDSRNGRFLSVQVLITATGIEQLQAINLDLRATGRVHMVI